MANTALGFTFNAAENHQEDIFDVYPSHWANLQIFDSEVRPTNDGTGLRLNIQFKVLDGKLQNRIFFAGLNIRNANADAQKIALGQLAQICEAINLPGISDSAQLHGHVLWGHIKLIAARDGYEAKNEVDRFKPFDQTRPSEQVDAIKGSAPNQNAPAAKPAVPPQMQAPVQPPVMPQPAAQPATSPTPFVPPSAPQVSPAASPQMAPATPVQPPIQWAMSQASAPAAPATPQFAIPAGSPLASVPPVPAAGMPVTPEQWAVLQGNAAAAPAAPVDPAAIAAAQNAAAPWTGPAQ